MATVPTEGYEEHMSAIATTNPATGEVLKSFEPMTTEQVGSASARADAGFAVLRASLVRPAGRVAAAPPPTSSTPRSTPIATMMTTEMGKTLASARAEVAKCAKACRFYADARRGLPGRRAGRRRRGRARAGRTRPTSRSGRSSPIMPWNFPLWQAMRFAAPALMAGNPGLLKHASNVPQTALFMEELFRRAGFPDGLVPDPAHRLGRGRGGADRPAGAGGHADRQRGGRPGGGGDRRAASSRRPCSSSAAATRSS